MSLPRYLDNNRSAIVHMDKPGSGHSWIYRVFYKSPVAHPRESSCLVMSPSSTHPLLPAGERYLLSSLSQHCCRCPHNCTTYSVSGQPRSRTSAQSFFPQMLLMCSLGDSTLPPRRYHCEMFCLFCFVYNRVSVFSPCYPGTSNHPASVSWVLELQAQAVLCSMFWGPLLCLSIQGAGFSPCTVPFPSPSLEGFEDEAWRGKGGDWQLVCETDGVIGLCRWLCPLLFSTWCACGHQLWSSPQLVGREVEIAWELACAPRVVLASREPPTGDHVPWGLGCW